MLNRILMGILDYRSSFYEFMRKMLWVFLLSLLFIVTSIPIFTVGASAVAMYSVLLKLIREKEFKLLGDYFTSFVKNFGKATIIWIICLILGVVCYIDITFFVGATKGFGAVGYVMLAVAVIITVVILMFALAMFPVLAEFEGSIKDTFTVVVFMIKKSIVKSFMAVVSTVAIAGFSIFVIVCKEYLFIYFPLLAFGLNGFILSYIYDSVLRPIYEEDEELEEYDGSEE